MSDIITKSDSPLHGLLWTREEEELLKDWALIANSFRWLHERASIKYKKLNNRIALPVIIISTLTGTANFGLSTLVSSHDQTWAQIAIGGANILCGVLTTVQTYFKYAENTEAHQNAAKSWSRFHRVISIELALEPNKRKHPSKFIKACIEEYNDLKEHSPIIPIDIADAFKSTFKTKKINLPDIYDNISNTNTYRDYVIKNVQSNDKIELSEIKIDNKPINTLKQKVIQQINGRSENPNITDEELKKLISNLETSVSKNITTKLKQMNDTEDNTDYDSTSSISIPSENIGKSVLKTI